MDTTEAVITAIKEVLKDETPNIEIKRESRLSDDVGLDSLDRIEVQINIERFYNIRLDDEVWERAETVGDYSKIVDDNLLSKVK